MLLSYVVVLVLPLSAKSLEDQPEGFISFHLLYSTLYPIEPCSMYFERGLFYFVSCNIVFRHETMISLLRCIEALVQCFSKRKVALDCGVIGSVNPILEQIWTCTLRVVGIKHLTDCGFSLLTMLLQVTTLLFLGISVVH